MKLESGGLTTTKDPNQAASLRRGSDIANDTCSNRDGGGTTGSLHSSESHELAIICRDGQSDIGENVYTKCSDKDYTATQNIGE